MIFTWSGRMSPSSSTEILLRRLKCRDDTDPGLEKWLSLNAEYAKIWPNIKVKKVPPPDFKEWEGKPDKF